MLLCIVNRNCKHIGTVKGEFPTPELITTWEQQISQQSYRSLDRFPLNNFKYSFTLFSKFFSSFPHGTCSLSVSRQYLALDETYHPLELQSQTTRLEEHSSYVPFNSHTGISPSMSPYFKRFSKWISTDRTSTLYNLMNETLISFQLELSPLHSLLLRASLLVSFPPLINMLKFRG